VLGSNPPFVGAPGSNALLDLLTRQVVLECLLCEFYDFVVRSEPQGDELTFGQAIDLVAPLGGSQGLQSQTLFKANHPILHFERVRPEFEYRDNHHYRQHQVPSRRKTRLTMQVKARIDNVGEIYGEEEEVKEGIESGVVLQVLRFVLTHA